MDNLEKSMKIINEIINDEFTGEIRLTFENGNIAELNVHIAIEERDARIRDGK